MNIVSLLDESADQITGIFLSPFVGIILDQSLYFLGHLLENFLINFIYIFFFSILFKNHFISGLIAFRLIL